MRSLRSPLPIRPCGGGFLGGARCAPVAQPRLQHGHGLGLVAVLAAVVLALGHQAGGQVGDADGAVGLVDVLAAGAAGAEGVDAQVGRVELHLFGLVGLGHHGHRAGAGVDAALAFGGRHPLHAVAAGLSNAAGRRRLLALDAQHQLLVAAQFGWRSRSGSRCASPGVRRSAGTCAPGRRRTAPIRHRRCRRGSRGRRCARRPGPSASARSATRPCRRAMSASAAVISSCAMAAMSASWSGRPASPARRPGRFALLVAATSARPGRASACSRARLR
jgi:hypothetical protein